MYRIDWNANKKVQAQHDSFMELQIEQISLLQRPNRLHDYEFSSFHHRSGKLERM